MRLVTCALFCSSTFRELTGELASKFTWTNFRDGGFFDPRKFRKLPLLTIIFDFLLQEMPHQEWNDDTNRVSFLNNPIEQFREIQVSGNFFLFKSDICKSEIKVIESNINSYNKNSCMQISYLFIYCLWRIIFNVRRLN